VENYKECTEKRVSEKSTREKREKMREFEDKMTQSFFHLSFLALN